ncbi:MAG: hypothetical protein ACKV2T_34090 [Kofleriaceae bacterium]
MQLHWKVLVASVLVALVFIGVGSVSGDTNDRPDAVGSGSSAIPPPTTDRWLPGQPYKTGEGALWMRSDLTVEEQALLDKPDPTMPGDAHARHEAAAAYQASFAAANLANARLGLVGLEEIGVVP